MFGASKSIGALVITAAFAGAATGQTYHVRDLGTLGGVGDTEAFALSRTGASPLVAGFATRADRAQRAFEWSGSIQEIIPLAPDTQSVAYGVDGMGRVVGVMYQLGEAGARSFRTGGQVLAGLGNFSARATNDAGDIAGFVSVVETVGLAGELTFDHACALRGSAPTLQDLGSMHGSHWSRGYAINNSGWIAGCSGTADDSGSRAVVWIGNTPSDLGTFAGAPAGAGEACAYAINDSGLTVGYCTGQADPGVRYAAAWWVGPSGNVTQVSNLGALPSAPGKPAWSYAYAVNNRGAVVGQSNGRAFLFEAGRMKDLSLLIPPGWFIVSARAINDTNYIAAWGVNERNDPHPLLLVPCTGDFNRDGMLSVQDIFDFLSDFFGNNLSADVNASGAVSVQDIFDFLASYFAGC